MREKQRVILGNMKMNMDKSSLVPYLKQLKKISKEYTTVGVAVPSIYLPIANKILKSSNVLLGAQDCSAYEKGAYTGSISANMLTDFDCDFCLVGHSECRQRGESDEDVGSKIDRLQENAIQIVLCVGESLEQRQKGTYLDFIKEQLLSALKHIDLDKLDGVSIAYEPVWAVGTGLVPTSDQIGEVAFMIKKLIADHVLSPTPLPYLLYGGSVKVSNIQSILAIPNIDGVLVGGACLNIEEFSSMIKINVDVLGEDYDK